MKLRAAIFDLYGTLLQVGPPRPEAGARWEHTWRAALGVAPRLTVAEFMGQCQQIVDAEHAAARAAGIAFPEVYWPAVVDAVLPDFSRLPPDERAGLPIYRADCFHSVHLMPGAADTLRAAYEAGLYLGLASNCQPYSLLELDDALRTAGLSRAIFNPQLSFLSFAHGFSKPDPHVFRLLTAHLRLLEVTPAETLMVGDRPDNDLQPARAQGWQTFAIGPDPAADWAQLAGQLGHLVPPCTPAS